MLLKFGKNKHKKAQKIYEQTQTSEFIRGYVNHFREKTQDKPLPEVRFVVFDTETTGLNPKKDEVISIGAVAVKNGAICFDDTLELYLQKASIGGAEAVETHQILSKDLQQGGDEEEVLKSFLEYIQGDVLVAHYAEFDVQMMNKIFRRHADFSLFNASLDTIHLAKRVDGVLSNPEKIKTGAYTLDTLCERFHIDFSIRHHAAGDALATAELLLILLQKAQKRGIKTLKNLLK